MTAEFYRNAVTKKSKKFIKIVDDSYSMALFFLFSLKKNAKKNHIDVLRISYKQNVRFFCTEQVYPFNYCLNLEH